MSDKLPLIFEQLGDDISCIDRFLGDDVITILSTTLSKDKIKRRLTLRGNCISERGAAALADMLKQNTILEQLSLDWNLLSASGTIALCRGFEVNVNLKQVDLRNNGITDEGAAALAESLLSNTTILEVDLRWNQITDKGAQCILDFLALTERKIVFNLHGNPISNSMMLRLDDKFRMELIVPAAVVSPPVTVFHPNHNHDNFIDSLQRDNQQLRRQCSQSQTMLSDYQRQLDVSALKIIEYEQEADRAKFRFDSVLEELTQCKLRMSQLVDEMQLLKQGINRDRHELSDQLKIAHKQLELEKASHQADLESLRATLKTTEASLKQMEELLDHTRNRHKIDVELFEKRWRDEQQIAYDMTQQCKDAKQEALDTKDELVTAKQLIIHYEKMNKSYDQRIDDLNTLHSQQLHTIMENHRSEMNEYSAQSTAQSKSMALLQAKYANVEAAMAKLQIEKLHDIEMAVSAERDLASQRYSSQITELRARLDAFLTTKTIMESKHSQLAQELQEVRTEHTEFSAEMKLSRNNLLEENTMLKNLNSDLRSESIVNKRTISQLQTTVDELRANLEDINAEKKEVYASLQDSVQDRQHLLALTEKLKQRLDSLQSTRTDEFERIERSVRNVLEKEFETLKIQLKITHTNGKSNSSTLNRSMMSLSESTTSLHG